MANPVRRLHACCVCVCVCVSVCVSVCVCVCVCGAARLVALVRTLVVGRLAIVSISLGRPAVLYASRAAPTTSPSTNRQTDRLILHTSSTHQQTPDSKKEEFRKYLEKGGVIDALTKGACLRGGWVAGCGGWAND